MGWNGDLIAAVSRQPDGSALLIWCCGFRPDLEEWASVDLAKQFVEEAWSPVEWEMVARDTWWARDLRPSLSRWRPLGASKRT
jgi:hypothetical protein